jgi:hypothetical protein
LATVVRHAKLTALSPGRVFAVALVVAFLNIGLWSVATPLFASPDEPAHVVRAVALVHGDLIGKTVKNVGNAVTDVMVPRVYASGPAYGGCFAFKDTVPASCAAPITRSTEEVATATPAGRYPPLYYAVVGIPSLFTASTGGLYLMRVVSALLSAVFIALAAMSVVAWSRSRSLLIGLMLAATPMTFFLAGVVNPNGLEITSALCLWCSGIVLALERSDHPPPGLVAVVTLSAAALLLSGALAPLWCALILILLALLSGWRGVRAMARAPSVRWSLAVLAPCGIFAAGWIIGAHALDVLPVGQKVKVDATGLSLAAQIFGNTGGWLQQMVGVFGWLDTYSPLLTYFAWYAAIGAVVLLALSLVKFRYAGVLLLLVAIVLFVPVVISYGQAHRLGIVWQGRYVLPMAAAIPLVAVALVERSGILRRVTPRLATTLCVVVGVAEFAAFAEALRRYTTGVTGPIDYLHGPWQPPLGATVTTVGALLVIGVTMALIRSLVVADPAAAGDSGLQRASAHVEAVPAVDREATRS